MPLYALRCRQRNNWIVEADLIDVDVSSLNFYPVEVTKTRDVIKREGERWWKLTGEDPKLYNGELISIRELEPGENGSLGIGIAKSDYREHRGSCPLEGEIDGWTKQFFPYDFELRNSVAVPKIPNSDKLFPSFAAATLIKTSDGKLVYLTRDQFSTNVYKGARSLNSGGRFNGKPHKMVDELIEDSSKIYGHIRGMLQQEYRGLDRSDVTMTHRLTGIARSLDDLDVTLCVYTEIDLTYQQLLMKLGSGKYSGISCVNANSDGIVTLLEDQRFPSTIKPVIVQAASIFDVDPRDIIPGLEIISE